jgi:zinc/manganese transport system ATP-binding protein
VTSTAGVAGAPLLSFHDLTLGYGARASLRGLTGEVRFGDLLAVVGPNGAGKSTLLKGIVGVAALLGGRIERHRAAAIRDIAYLPQRAEIDTSFPISVQDFVAMGLWRRIGAWRRLGRAEDLRVDAAIAQVGLQGFEAVPIGRLSGGQVQRMLFARTVVQDAAVILLDEPCAALDERTAADLMTLVREWGREGRTVLATLHDLDQVRASFPRTLILSGGVPVAWGETARILTPDNLGRSRGAAGPEAGSPGASAPLREGPALRLAAAAP